MKKNAAKIPVDYEITEEQLATLLSDAHAGNCAFEWWKPENESDYDAAKTELKKERPDDEICMEDIWARLLFNGKKLSLLEAESDYVWADPEGNKYEMIWTWQIEAWELEPSGGTWHSVGLQDIVKGIGLYLKNQPCNKCGNIEDLLEEGDFYDADAVMQYAVFNDIIFG